MALIGLLSLSGMLIRNGIVLVEEIEQQKQEKPQHEAIIYAATSRCALYSHRLHHRAQAGAAAAGRLLPEYGGGYMFGLGFATILTLLVLPVFTPVSTLRICSNHNEHHRVKYY
jgi:multidrug efflux pump subunit AcrB